LLKSKLEKFLAKRVLFIFVVLTIYIMVCIRQKWFAFAGLAIGASLSILKLSSYVYIFSKIISPENANESFKHGASKSVINFVLNQIIVLIVLFVSLKFNQWFFIGIVAGILLIPLAIVINSFTEALRITHNNFE
jgi:hypothetical protein